MAKTSGHTRRAKQRRVRERAQATAAAKEEWGVRFSSLMDGAKVSASDLAESVKVVRSAVYHWRLGSRIPSPAIQPDIARRLGVTVAELNGWAA